MRFHSLKKVPLLSLLLVAAVYPSVSRAVDGVIEINQASALAGGITPGDAPGFPVTLSLPGSYRLTSNLTVSNPNVDGIDITADSVSLDLNGFAVVGPVNCGSPQSLPSCAPAGSGIGISGGFYALIQHGTVRGFGGDGVLVYTSSKIDNLLATSNGGRGIGVPPGIGGLLIENSRAIQNGGLGIDAGSYSTVQRSVAEWNGSGGISTSFASLVIGNAASQNGGFGISAPSGSVIRENVAASNQGDGIDTGNGSLVSHNSAFQNSGSNGVATGVGNLVTDNSAGYNAATGIAVGAGSSVQRNTAAHNGGDGLYLFLFSGDPPAYLENVMDANGAVPVIGGLNMGANYCNGATCLP